MLHCGGVSLIVWVCRRMLLSLGEECQADLNILMCYRGMDDTLVTARRHKIWLFEVKVVIPSIPIHSKYVHVRRGLRGVQHLDDGRSGGWTSTGRG